MTSTTSRINKTPQVKNQELNQKSQGERHKPHNRGLDATDKRCY